MHVTLVIRGLRPQIKILDNEFSKLLLDFMGNDDVDLQLVPEHINRKNAAEREIRTWKNISWPDSVALMTDFQIIFGVNY